MKKFYEKLNVFELNNQINHWKNEILKISAPIRNPIDEEKVIREESFTQFRNRDE